MRARWVGKQNDQSTFTTSQQISARPPQLMGEDTFLYLFAEAVRCPLSLCFLKLLSSYTISFHHNNHTDDSLLAAWERSVIIYSTSSHANFLQSKNMTSSVFIDCGWRMAILLEWKTGIFTHDYQVIMSLPFRLGVCSFVTVKAFTALMVLKDK